MGNGKRHQRLTELWQELKRLNPNLTFNLLLHEPDEGWIEMENDGTKYLLYSTAVGFEGIVNCEYVNGAYPVIPERG